MVRLIRRARFFANNNAFHGNNQLSQNPLAVFSGFYSHNISKRMFAGIGVSYDNGGETYINSISQHNAANGFRPGVSLSRARTIWKNRLTLRYELTGTTPKAAPTNSLFSIRLSGRFSKCRGDRPATNSALAKLGATKRCTMYETEAQIDQLNLLR